MRTTSTRHAVSNALSVRSDLIGHLVVVAVGRGGASDVAFTQCTQTCGPQTYWLGTE